MATTYFAISDIDQLVLVSIEYPCMNLVHKHT